MSLGPEFFEERQVALKKYESEGYIALAEVVDDSPDWEHALEKLGYIRGRQITSTAELYDWDVTEAGKKYLLQGDLQIVAVHEKDVPEFKLLLRSMPAKQKEID